MNITANELLAKIAGSSRGIGIIGTTAIHFDFDAVVPGTDKMLKDILLEKFTAKGCDYTVTILRESESQIVQYVQYEFGSKMIGTKDFEYYRSINNAYFKLRQYFNDKKSGNLEPPENMCRKALDKLFDKLRVEGVVENLLDRDYNESELIKGILGIVVALYDRVVQVDIMSTPEFNIFEKKFTGIEEARKTFSEAFSAWFRPLLMKTFDFIKTADQLCTLSDAYSKITVKDKFQYKGFPFDVDFGISKEDSLRSNLVEASFEYLALMEDENYDDIKNVVSSIAFQKRERELKRYKQKPEYLQRFVLKTVFDVIETQIVRVDDDYFTATPYFPDIYTFVGRDDGSAESEQNFQLQIVKKQYDRCLNTKNAIEITEKGDRKEYVNSYINISTLKYIDMSEEEKREEEKKKNPKQNRMHVGLRARESFNFKKPQSMMFIKNVAWALVFDHNGNLLLHRRGMNAKDNQGMWDKSVGGHIAHNDPDAIFGARREILEELYETEGFEQGHANKPKEKENAFVTKDPEKIRFFGQWKQGFYPKLNKGITLDPDEFYCFKYNDEFLTEPQDSERKLPSGQIVSNKCFVDLFFVVTSDSFDVSSLKNSKYLLLPPSIIRDFYNSRILPAQYSPTGTNMRFEVTHDLARIIDKMWDVVGLFSNEVREAFADRK